MRRAQAGEASEDESAVHEASIRKAPVVVVGDRSGQLEAASSRIPAKVSGLSSAEKWPVWGTVMR